MDPTATTPKFKDVAESVTGALPVPLRLTFCGLFVALSVKVSVPRGGAGRRGSERHPDGAVGPGGEAGPARVAGDRERPADSDAAEMVRAALWRLVSVTVTAALVVPTVTDTEIQRAGGKRYRRAGSCRRSR